MIKKLLNHQNVKPLLRKLQLNFSLPIALALIIFVACLIVGFAYFIYWNDPYRKYDLARPGQKQSNQALSIEDEQADTTSPVDVNATKDKIEFLKKEVKALDSISSFRPDDLNNKNIQLAPADQPSF